MNGLTLRINRAGTSKVKNPLSFHPIILPNGFNNVLDNEEKLAEFNECQSIEKQLNIVKKFLNSIENSPELIKFLVVVYLQADIKHPIKCFLARHITKTPELQNNFSESLANELSKCIKSEHNGLKQYEDVVTKVSSCIENFPAGSAAVKMVENPLAEYLTRCLESCVQTLRNVSTLSPTERSEIFTLSHSCLRLLLHIIQKKNSTDAKFTSLTKTIKTAIKELTFDDDAPMDTKSLSGILYLTIHLLQFGPHSWLDIFDPQNINEDLEFYIQSEASKLCLYSAVATVIPMDRLEANMIRDQPAVIVLLAEIIAISERCASESAFVLGVSRAVSQLSRATNKMSRATALRLVASALSFVWAHLEHHMDSVRHLSAQTLVALVKYSTKLDRDGDSVALNELFKCVGALERSRKSYYVAVTSLTAELGASAMLQRIPDLIPEAIRALSVQAVQASATTTLETVLDKHAAETSAPVLHEQWVMPILTYVNDNSLDPSVLNILESVMTRAVKLDQQVITYILPYINEWNATLSQVDIKCVLLLLSVYRKSASAGQACEDPTRWKGLISYRLLEAAAFHACHQTRSLCLSLVVESPRSTEVLMHQELQLVLHYLRYNINEQAPHHRQLTLATTSKLLKRVEDSYRVFLKQRVDSTVDYYVEFVESLREQCFRSLLAGCNYSRRSVALHLLKQCEIMQLGDYKRTWKRDYVEKLLVHLEDSYEKNKALALDVLKHCPVELLQMGGYSVSLDVDGIVGSLSLIKPTECVSAAYKLMLLRDKLPSAMARGRATAEAASYALLQRLLGVVRAQLQQCRSNILLAAANAPLYPPLHCARRLFDTLSPTAIAGDASWSDLVEEYISVCVEVTATVACVVNNSSPEGHLPMDMGGVHLSDHGNSSGITLQDGRQVTAQMVLLCSWRSAKEMALLLGGLASLTVVGEEHPDKGTLSPHRLLLMGEHLRTLLTQTKHRGAFEQAYVGLTQIVSRMRRCRNAILHEKPGAWLNEQLEALETLEALDSQSDATRRSAGLPYALQALAGSEAQTHACVARLLRVAAGEGPSAVHAVNSLRALFRCAALQGATAAHKSRALLVALRGFERASWAQRNACTLLLSALVVRVFGVQRTKDGDALCSRNKMTGRIFFLRYPHLYDYMLNKLKEMSEESKEGGDKLRPSLYPILLLLARLYPSALEGTVSNLKVTSFVPYVVSCARSCVSGTRHLAARALVPLVPPQRYLAHVAETVALLGDVAIERNFCHGLLLQLTRLVDARPEGLEKETATTAMVRDGMCHTIWIVAQTVDGHTPCFPLATAYAQLVNALISRFPDLITETFINRIEILLHRLLFVYKNDKITSGKDVCLSNCLYLYLIVLHKHKQDCLYDIIEMCLSHECYDVVLTALNYLLILHKKLEIENKFQSHLDTLPNQEVLKKIRHNKNYVRSLCRVIKSNIYKECVQKALQMIVLEKNTQKYIISGDEVEMCQEIVMRKLLEKIRDAPECFTHIYLESLLNFTSDNLKSSTGVVLLEVLRLLLDYGSSENGDDLRAVVVEFIAKNSVALFRLDLVDLDSLSRFEFKSTLLSIIVTLLEDDDVTLRQKTARVVTRLSGVTGVTSQSSHDVISTRAAELLRDWIEGYVTDVDERITVYVLLSLLDFKSEVCLTDEVNDECRVFDQNEKYNIYLEETIWTSECAKLIIKTCEQNRRKHVKDFIVDVIEDNLYRNTLDKLCGKNMVTFKTMFADQLKGVSVKTECSGIVNPKIQLFVDLIFSI